MKPGVIALGAALLVTIATTGCNSGGANCSAAANNAVALIRAELEREGASEGADNKERQTKESMLPALKEELVKHCKAESWSSTVRSCIAEAKSTAALEACDPDKNLAGAKTKKAPADDKPPADDKAPAEDTKPPADDTQPPADDTKPPTDGTAPPADKTAPAGTGE